MKKKFLWMVIVLFVLDQEVEVIHGVDLDWVILPLLRYLPWVAMVAFGVYREERKIYG